MRPEIEEFPNYMSRLFPEENNNDCMIRTVTIQVTDECNLACTYCYQVDKGSHVIDAETAKVFLNRILTGDNEYINFDNCSGMILDLIGGEPFMAVDVMYEISRWFIERMIDMNHPWLLRSRISVSSNGTLYFTPAVQRYINTFSGFLSLSISLDGNKKLHDACRIYPNGEGSYDQVVAAAQDWMTRNVRVGSKLTLAPANIAHTAAALQNMVSIGYVAIFCNCIFEDGWELSDATTLYKQLVIMTDWLCEHALLDTIFISMFDDKMFYPKAFTNDTNWCGGTGNMIAVDYKGDIFPCLRYMESSLGPNVPALIIGTVSDGIGVTQEQKQTINCLQCVTWRSQCTDECHHCPISSGCAWCSACNYQYAGNVNRLTRYLCEMHKARALANVYFWIKYNEFMCNGAPVINNVPKEWAIPIIGEDELSRLDTMLNDYMHGDHIRKEGSL